MRRHSTPLLLFLFALMAFNSESALAGTISSAESKILAAVYEVYEYNGELYQALPEYTEQVREYLQQDDVDLTEQDCNELLGMIEANLPSAIESGYFVKIEKETEKIGSVVEGEKGHTSTDYIDEPENSGKDQTKDDKKKGKKKKKKKSENNKSEEKDDSKDNKTDNSSEGNETATVAEEQASTVVGKTESPSDDNEMENMDGIEDSAVSSQDKEEQETESGLLDSDNVFEFWYQADQERKEKETHTVTLLAIIVVGLLVLIYAGKMIYRYYVLYLSHPHASSRWKPEYLSDMHCHLLPGVDDGSMNMDMTRKLLQMEIENGVDTILFTPHFKRGKSRFSNEKLFQIFEEVKEEALKMKPGMKLYLGEELYYDHSLCHAIEEGKALKLNGTDYVLVEFSPDVEYKTIHKACQNLVMSGVTPILAHIERYPALIAKTDRLIEIHEMGVYYQMNITSIMGSNFSGRVYKQRKLVADGWIDIVGSDSHDDKSRNPKFKKAWKDLLKLCDDEMIERIMWQNPAKILAGEDIEA